jgi:hypothetical protein
VIHAAHGRLRPDYSKENLMKRRAEITVETERVVLVVNGVRHEPKPATEIEGDAGRTQASTSPAEADSNDPLQPLPSKPV